MKPTKRGSVRMCAYCRELFHRNNLTVDHVPPRGVFGKEWRKGKELPWVDCCRGCRTGCTGDEILKMLAGLGVIRTEEADNVRQEMNKRIDTPSHWRKGLVQSIRAKGTIPVLYDGFRIGDRIVLPQGMSVELDETLKRTARGLLFEKHPGFDTMNHEFEVVQVDETRLHIVQEVLSTIRSFSYGRRVGESAFIAAWNFTVEDPTEGMMFMCFFGGLNFFVFFRDRSKPRRQVQ